MSFLQLGLMECLYLPYYIVLYYAFVSGQLYSVSPAAPVTQKLSNTLMDYITGTGDHAVRLSVHPSVCVSLSISHQFPSSTPLKLQKFSHVFYHMMPLCTYFIF